MSDVQGPAWRRSSVAKRQDGVKVLESRIGDTPEGSEDASGSMNSDDDTRSESSTDSKGSYLPRGNDNSPSPRTDGASASSIRGPTYLTVSFTPLAQALGFGHEPPGDVIMRGWAWVLRPGGGRGGPEGMGGIGGGVESGRNGEGGRNGAGDDGNRQGGGDGGADRGADIVLDAPGDASCVTLHPASEHVFDYR